MSLPWLQEVDPAELLPDDTKWAELDELTLYKQCKLRGMDKSVEKEGDSLRILNALTNFKLKWTICPANADPMTHLPHQIVNKKALTALLQDVEKETFQVIHVSEIEERTGKRIVLSNATVKLCPTITCTCDHSYDLGFRTCIHRLYLFRYVLKFPQHYWKENGWYSHHFHDMFRNTPLVFKPSRYIRGDTQTVEEPVSETDCQLCFKVTDGHNGALQCEACRRIAHKTCHDIYRALKGRCDHQDGCWLCCPKCPWNPSSEMLDAKLLLMGVKEEPEAPREGSATADDAVLSATKQKVRRLEKKVRKLRGQLRGQGHRKPTSRTMTDRQYKKLVAKAGGRVGNHRTNKGTMCQTNTPKKEEACVKEERQADVSGEPTTPVEQTVKEEKCVKIEEESEPAVEIVKVEPRRKVKSEPVVISLL